MPRQNPARAIAAELRLPERIAAEREERGWTYEALAHRMTAAGCPIQASSIYKSEKGNPPRLVRPEELVALARVFGVSVDELLLPAAMVRSRRIQQAFARFLDAREQSYRATSEFQDASLALANEIGEDPAAVRDALVMSLNGDEEQAAKVIDGWESESLPHEQRTYVLSLMLRNEPEEKMQRLVSGITTAMPHREGK